MLQHRSGVTDATGSSITTVITALNGFNFVANYPFWHWIVEDNNTQCVADVGGRGREADRDCRRCLSQHREVTRRGRARVCTRAASTLCQFVPLRFLRLRLRVQPVPACRKSEWVFVGDQTLPSSSLWSQQEAEKAPSRASIQRCLQSPNETNPSCHTVQEIHTIKLFMSLLNFYIGLDLFFFGALNFFQLQSKF